ncbi:PH domain-containing protein DDB_G0275795-like isoform X2 [Varroa jacobsoni]|uniref:Regulatory factor X-associated protein RFXANK-binding domain-containing protein n=1 Tax=Varroa destructor TaxID=109461 RepID=A0A7M7JDP8_VARDE|nr:PH domain-containing protein DDB_G0275795-like isoform X2 [Varroa destructor]XP_022692077.1 PH domain-containing protein DDB_G0275795-like isoform X2 [Varroa jacobsoni]
MALPPRMFAGDERSSSSSCHSGEFKRSHSQLEENASIPESNENVVAIGDEVLGALLNSVLREKRQSLLRSPQVAALLASREQSLLQLHENQQQRQQQHDRHSHQQADLHPPEQQSPAPPQTPVSQIDSFGQSPSHQNNPRAVPITATDRQQQIQQLQQQQQQRQQQLNLPPSIRPPLSSNHLGNN